jgi:hypothetical protein
MIASIGIAGQLLGSVNNNIAYAAQTSLYFIYSTEVTKDTTTNIAKKYLTTDLNNYAGQSYWQTIDRNFGAEVYSAAPNNKKIMFAASLQWMKEAVPVAKKHGVSILAYDAEIWKFTPSWEQNNPVEAFNKAAYTAHSNGFKFAYNPTMKIFKGPDVNYLKQDWKKCDMLIIPYAGLLVYPDNFKTQVQKVVNHVKSENPNIEIIIGISLRYASPNQIITAIDSVRSYIDGTSISYHPDAKCTYCSEANLDKVLAGVS